MSCGAKFVLLRGFFAIVMDIDGHRWTLLTGIISTNMVLGEVLSLFWTYSDTLEYRRCISLE